MEKKSTLFFKPFGKIAGGRALLWGAAGLAVSIVLTYLNGFHYHGMLQLGPGSNNALWCFAAERVVVWLVPAILFYLGGLIASKSRIRPIDVLGTVAFAQIPMIGMDLINFLPVMQRLKTIDLNMPAGELALNPDVLLSSIFGLIGVVFIVWSLIWMFNALKVSCNLKGVALWIIYLVGVFGGDVIVRLINPIFY